MRNNKEIEKGIYYFFGERGDFRGEVALVFVPSLGPSAFLALEGDFGDFTPGDLVVGELGLPDAFLGDVATDLVAGDVTLSGAGLPARFTGELGDFFWPNCATTAFLTI
jgi:hypothetical protein